MGKVKSGLLPWSGPIELFHEAVAAAGARKQRHSQEFGAKKSSKKRSSQGSSPSSFWGSWTSILRHQLNRSYQCVFSLHIHSVRNLPRSADGLLVEVHCIRKSRSSRTLQSRCSGGAVEFEETLHLRSRVRATRNFPHTIKHPVSKSVRLLVVSPGSRVPVLGEVELDLGSTLPAAIADTIDYASRTAWTSAFRVSSPTGVIKGASLVASIGYEFLDPEGVKQRASGSRSGSSLWRRIRPLSSTIVSSSSNASFARSESMRSMPDLCGLAREAYDSDEGLEDEEEPNGDENRPPSDCLDLALCSLVHAQMERTNDERDQQPQLTMRKSFEVRADDHGSSEDGDLEPLVLEVLVPVQGFGAKIGADDDASEDAVMDSIEQEKLALFMNKSREEEPAVDEAIDEEEIALQFLRMLKDEPMLPLVKTTGGEALGAPVYEATNWLLSSIPEEEASEDQEEPTATTTTTTTMTTMFSSSASSSLNAEPEVDSAELHAFMPLWRREDYLELESIMQAAEAELQKAMKL